MAEITDVTACDVRVASCRCREPFGHEGPHRCDSRCGGAWEGDSDDDFVPVAWPSMFPVSGLEFDAEW